MRIFPIIPIWLMIIICIALVLFIFIFKKNKATWYELGVVIIIFIINLRIMFPTDNANVLTNNLDVLFVIDNTVSMYAEDYGSKNEPRMDAVKEDCFYIINNLGGARFSLITFNNYSKIALPYTYDNDIVVESIDILLPLNEFYARGSSLNTPLEDMISVLKRNFKNGENRRKIIFFISDGEITDESKLESFKEVSNYIDDGAVLGYGTADGGYMHVTDEYTGEVSYLEDRSDWPYKNAVSKMDENNLKSIAKDIKVSYIKMDKQKDIDKKLKEIKNSSKTKTENVDQLSYTDIYYIFLIPLIILLFLIYREYRRMSK